MIGLGKLGEPCATVMSKHYDVVGYDIQERNTSFPMKSSIKETVQDRDFIFIAAPTPHDSIYGGETPSSHLPNRDFDYSTTAQILKEVNKYVTKKQLVILISTVLPGTVRNSLRKYISNGRFIYNPYLIAMGTVAYDFVNPEMIIIGTEDGSVTGDANELIDFYKPMMNNNPRYEVGTWDEAESIKIFYNTFISTKIALVNMIQDVAETNGNINVDVVTQALAKSTHRITSSAYMKAGMGDAGACHPRDNIALRYLAERLDLGYDLFDSIMTARELQAKRLAQKCLSLGKNVTIVGKAYKPSVPYTNGSYSLLVGYYVNELGGTVNYYDIHTGDTDLRTNSTDVYLIGYWEKYVEELRFPDNSIVIDPWRQFDKSKHNGTVIHYGNTRPEIVETINEVEVKRSNHEARLNAETTNNVWMGDDIATARLKGGIFLKYPRKLDGGGLDFKDDLLEVIRSTGKYSYNRAFEWCAGFGALGYELLGMGFCNHIVFSDMYKDAIDNCLDTANANNLTKYVTGYHCDKIIDIPDNEKWDLVVSNPPHCLDLTEFKTSMASMGKTNETSLNNSIRLCVDQDYKIHDEFFKNVGKHLTHDADIYLIEAQYMESTVHMANLYGLRFISSHKMKDTTMPQGVILHFKP